MTSSSWDGVRQSTRSICGPLTGLTLAGQVGLGVAHFIH
jgi:hypothetical protein